MSQSGEAADQVVNMAANVATKVAEVGADVAIKGSVSLGTFLIAALKDQKRTKGRVRLQSFQGKPTKVFIVQRAQLKDFAIECKKYGVVYAAVLSKKDPNGLVDIIIHDADAAKVNRIAERFGISAVDVENLRNECSHSREQIDSEQHAPDTERERTDPAAERAARDTFLGELLQSEPAATPTQKQPFAMDENPTMAWMDEAHNPFAHLSENSRHSDAILNEPSRPSVRQEIRARKAGRTERQRGLPEPERGIALPAGKEQSQLPAGQITQLPPPAKSMDKVR